MKNVFIFFFLVASPYLFFIPESYGQVERELIADSFGLKPPVGDWVFAPQYTLEGNAKNYPGPVIEMPQSPFAKVSTSSYPLIFHGEEPTQRIVDFLDTEKLPQNAFSVELLLLDHVNQPVGALVTEKGRNANEEPAWLLGYYEKDIIFTLVTEEAPTGTILNAQANQPWKRYWHHVVGVYDGKAMQLYLNGVMVKSTPVGPRNNKQEEKTTLELAAYMNHEPYMDLENLVRTLRIYDHAISETQVQQRFGMLKSQVEWGILFPDIFHFNAGPYLHFATQQSINLVWETDRPSRANIWYGTRLPLTEHRVVTTYNTLHEFTLEGLAPETSYFYNITATDEQGKTIESGILTFSTAVKPESAFYFALIGDTEARPHINDRIAQLVWDERPNFVLNMGDLTDGGTAPHKFEWNYEYFAGTRQLHSRIPVFPVPGNGEDDLYWYKQYHKLPGNEAYYKFTYGNAEFFMLNSNDKEVSFAPGGEQYEWLKVQLAQSTAPWKFVAHHHAPYSADENDYGNAWEGPTNLGDAQMRQIVPLYEQYGVDMVFFGHLHTYQRTMPIAGELVNEKNGVIYIQCGGGGGNLEDFVPARAWFSAKTYRGHHYATITLSSSHLSYKMYDTEGRMKDFLELKK